MNDSLKDFIARLGPFGRLALLLRAFFSFPAFTRLNNANKFVLHAAECEHGDTERNYSEQRSRRVPEPYNLGKLIMKFR